MDLIKQLAAELSLPAGKVQQTVALLDEGNTIPFIARYRKEVTGEMDEVVLRQLEEQLQYLRNLQNRKEEVERLINEQEKLTPEIAASITEAKTLQELDDIYRPFRPKRRTRASMAKEKGLEPLALLVLKQDDTDLDAACEEFLSAEVPDAAAARQGALDILAEHFTDEPSLRQFVRRYTWDHAVIRTEKAKNVAEAEAHQYQMYFDYEEPLKRIPPHRVLAINRGEKEDALKVKVTLDMEPLLVYLLRRVVTNPRSPAFPWLQEALHDGYQRLLAPSMERELRNSLTETAEEHAIGIFGKNLSSLLMQPPVSGRTILGIDPAYRTGCKVVVINTYGDLLHTSTIYPHQPQGRWQDSIGELSRLIGKHSVDLIAIGNGTASRETESLAAELVKDHPKLQYLVINEAGASVYSASDLARQEFPELDVSLRGAVSIARRVQDPLAELVKIDPKSIGVGQYQHDVNQKELAGTLQAVVESCVNYVGVELNSASPALLQYVAGLSAPVARNVLEYRQANGPFQHRKQLLKVKGLGPKAYEQAAGFLRIREGENPLDNTAVHPESYQLAERILAKLNRTLDDLSNKEALEQLRQQFKKLNVKTLAAELEAGEPTVKDILDSLAQPGRDPRDELPPPLFRGDVLTIEDLHPGIILRGTVQNVVDFGAFVDIGVKKAGLVHISQIRDQYVRHPTDVLQVGDIVTVQVLSVDVKTGRIGLTMKIKE